MPNTTPSQKESLTNKNEEAETAIPPSKKTPWIPINAFKIGYQVRRLFDDGEWYVARVMTEPRLVFDVEKGIDVLSRKVKYYFDEQEEWFDEQQLNEYAYNEGDHNVGSDHFFDGYDDQSNSDDDGNYAENENIMNKEGDERHTSFPDFPSDGDDSNGVTTKSSPKSKNQSTGDYRVEPQKMPSADVEIAKRKEDELKCTSFPDFPVDPEDEDTGFATKPSPEKNKQSPGDCHRESIGATGTAERKEGGVKCISFPDLAGEAEDGSPGVPISPSPKKKKQKSNDYNNEHQENSATATGNITAGSQKSAECTDKKRLRDLPHSEHPFSATTSRNLSVSSSSSDENVNRRRSNRERKKVESYLSASSVEFSSSSKKPPSNGTSNGRRKTGKLGVNNLTKKEARHILIDKMGICEKEVDWALDKMPPPYSQNEVVNFIHKEREKKENGSNDGSEQVFVRFKPETGMKVRVREGGSSYHGEVTKGPTYMKKQGDSEPHKFWEVTFLDGKKEDLDWNELFLNRASRPIVKGDGCRGRTLYALELFSGEGIVTQEFCEKKWCVKSIDNRPESYATNILDLMEIKYRDIGFVPDFIWASPPCTTCSPLSGSHHRDCKNGEFEKTKEASDHNLLMAQMMYILNWAKKKNPHLIVVIENPRGQMQNLPMMIEFARNFGLHKATVDYCVFGRPDKKPTNLWTNEYDLFSRLSLDFRCREDTCPYHCSRHPASARGYTNIFNVAAIPKQLAEEVADYVHSRFYFDRVAHSPRATLSREEEEEFDFRMSRG